MKIIVDKMPDNIYDCPYFVDNSNMYMTNFCCMYNNSACSCHIDDNPKYNCKHFIDLSYAISNMNQSFIEH